MVPDPHPDFPGVTCIICCSAVDEEQPWKLPCGHRQWHRSCVEGWLVQRQTCPMCRAPFGTPVENKRDLSQDALLSSLVQLLIGSEPLVPADCEALVRALQAVLDQEAQMLDQHREALVTQVHGIEQELSEHLLQIRELRATQAVETSTPDRGADGTNLLAADEEAVALLARVAAAVLRTGLSAQEVFRSLPEGGSPLGDEASMSFLSAFGGVSEVAVSVAAKALDINGSGFIEEDDFVDAMIRFQSKEEISLDDLRLS